MSIRSQNVQFGIAWFVIALSLRCTYSPDDIQGLSGWWLTPSESSELSMASTFFYGEEEKEDLSSDAPSFSIERMRKLRTSWRQSRTPDQTTSRRAVAAACRLSAMKKQGSQESDGMCGENSQGLARGQVGLARNAMAQDARRFLFRRSASHRAMIHSAQPKDSDFKGSSYFSDALLALMPLMILNSLFAGGALRKGEDPSRHVKRSPASPKESRGTARRRLSREQPAVAKVPRAKADAHAKAAQFSTCTKPRKQRFIAVKM